MRVFAILMVFGVLLGAMISSSDIALAQTAELKGAQDEQLLMNINNATKEQLQEIRGIGPALADRIIQYRSENGSFESVEHIMNVRGIGEEKFKQIRSVLTV